MDLLGYLQGVLTGARVTPKQLHYHSCDPLHGSQLHQTCKDGILPPFLTYHTLCTPVPPKTRCILGMGMCKVYMWLDSWTASTNSWLIHWRDCQQA